MTSLEKNKPDRPVLLITGASGFVGKSFLRFAEKKFFIYALAQRSQQDAGIPSSQNICWLQVDITDNKILKKTIHAISQECTVDFIFHFAVYYDYFLQDSPIYDQVNVTGTRNILECIPLLKPKRFIFSSSLAVTGFHRHETIIKENSTANADNRNPYIRTKIIAENLVRESATDFPCAIIRMPAIFTDWCEHPPLYALLHNWQGKGLLSNVIVGRGETAIPYIHAADLNRFFQKMMDVHDKLTDFEILLATPNMSVSHLQLFKAVKKENEQADAKPFHCPVWLAWLALTIKNLLGRAAGHRPFEQPWMLKYIDRKMKTDASKTKSMINWKTRPCHHLPSRLFKLVHNMKNNPEEWRKRNSALLKRA